MVRNDCVQRSLGALLSLSETFASLWTDIACRRTIVHFFGSDSSKSVKPIQ